MTYPRERQLPWIFTRKICNFTANSKWVCQFNFSQTANKVNESSPWAALGPQRFPRGSFLLCERRIVLL